MNGKTEPISGEQQPVMTVYGERDRLMIRLEREDLMDLAQAIANVAGSCWVITPSRCAKLQQQSPQPQPLQPHPQQQQPLQTQPQPSAETGWTTCNRCAGVGTTSRGICPVCQGRKVVKT
jgi:hypothetical protein